MTAGNIIPDAAVWTGPPTKLRQQFLVENYVFDAKGKLGSGWGCLWKMIAGRLIPVQFNSLGQETDL